MDQWGRVFYMVKKELLEMMPPIVFGGEKWIEKVTMKKTTYKKAPYKNLKQEQ